MEFQKLSAEVRFGRKKGTARQLRRQGRIPAVCYGRGTASIALSVDPKVLAEALGGSFGRNAVIEMQVSGAGAPSEPVLVMLQEAQSHPVSRELLHVDFLTVSRERDVSVDVPLRLTGKAAGVQAGGVLAQVFRSLPVRCRIDSIPGELTLDVTALELGDILKVADLVLPEGVAVELEPSQTLASVTTPSKVVEETEEGAAEEGAEAAPGAAAEAGKAGKEDEKEGE